MLELLNMLELLDSKTELLLGTMLELLNMLELLDSKTELQLGTAELDEEIFTELELP
jgi:hypothetical protein